MKRFTFRSVTVFLSLTIFSFSAQAHPTSYKGAVGIMGWNQPFLTDYWTTYSFESNQAIAARLMRMEMKEGTVYLALPQYDLLVKRWNEKNLQANLYATAGFGGLRMDSHNGTAGLAGVEADAESRKYFISGKGEWMAPSFGSRFNHYEFRLGISAYEAEFNELASWFMVQVQLHPSLVEKQAVTPLGRFFYKNVLWEVGMSLKGSPFITLMFHL